MKVRSAVVLSTLNVMAPLGAVMLQDTFPLAPFAPRPCDGRVSAWTKKLTRERQAVRNFGTAAAYSSRRRNGEGPCDETEADLPTNCQPRF